MVSENLKFKQKVVGRPPQAVSILHFRDLLHLNALLADNYRTISEKGSLSQKLLSIVQKSVFTLPLIFLSVKYHFQAGLP